MINNSRNIVDNLCTLCPDPSAQISLSHVHVDRHQAAKDAGSLALACLFSPFRDVSKDGERNR